jgi:energy-coupling factor transport system permease protein
MTQRVDLHPVFHILLCLLLSSLVFAVSSPLNLLALSLVAFFYASLRISNGLRGAFKTLRRSFPLLLSIAIVQLLFRRQGEVIWSFGFLTFRSVGLNLAILLCLRLITVIYAARILAALSFQDFSLAFATLKLPEELSFMLSYAVHLVPRFLFDLKGFVTGLKLRGIDPGKLSFSKRLQVFKMLAVASLAEIIRTSEISATALELRGFRSKGKRTFLYQRTPHAGETAVFLLFAGLFCLIAVL